MEIVSQRFVVVVTAGAVLVALALGLFVKSSKPSEDSQPVDSASHRGERAVANGADALPAEKPFEGWITSGIELGPPALSSDAAGASWVMDMRGVREVRVDIRPNGRLPQDVVKRGIHSTFARLRSCYESAAAHVPRTPDLEHIVRIDFEVAPNGSVSTGRATPDEAQLDAAFADCVVRVVEALTFPGPDGGVAQVTYVLAFQ